MQRMPRFATPAAVTSVVVALWLSPPCLASAFLSGAYYRLGDADPGAAAGAVGNDPTVDSFSGTLNLSRTGSPHYAADVPARGPAENKLSMSFANIGLGGPAFPAGYGRGDPLPVVVQGIQLESWVKAGPTNLDLPVGVGREELLAYNGNPAANGFGFFLSGDQYVLRLGAPDAPAKSVNAGNDRVLGPADVGAWHHLAYVYSLGTSSYYYDGKLVAQSTSDSAPLAASGGFFLGGQASGDNIQHGFNGWLDEVRYQSFNPIAAGAFEPASFLIVPEPAAAAGLLISGGLALLARRRH